MRLGCGSADCFAATVMGICLVHGETVLDGKGQPVGTVKLQLTWAGHAFLAAASNDTIWHKAATASKSPE